MYKIHLSYSVAMHSISTSVFKGSVLTATHLDQVSIILGNDYREIHTSGMA